MAFTTWSALRTAILDDIAANPEKVLNKSYTTPGGTSVTFRDLREVMEFIREIDAEISSASDGIPSTFVTWGAG